MPGAVQRGHKALAALGDDLRDVRRSEADVLEDPGEGHLTEPRLLAQGPCGDVQIGGGLLDREEPIHRAGARGLDACHGREACLLYTSPSPRDRTRSRMPSSA